MNLLNNVIIIINYKKYLESVILNITKYYKFNIWGHVSEQIEIESPHS